MPEKWQRLYLANDGDIPPLLYKYSSASSGYELYMTDLNYIWSERLDRKAILRRAEEDNTPIDPSEDLDQFNVLLSKIQEGLQNGLGSKVSLSLKSRGNAHTLELTVISKLPAPLEPLVWNVFLSKEAQSSTTRHLLLPLINAEAEQEARQRSLIQELNKKDWVLAKLFDKFESLGVDLATIFPGTSGIRAGRKGLPLTEMGKYIKGLAPFDEDSWRDELSKSSSVSALSANIVAELSDGFRSSAQLDSLEPPPNGWWEGLTVPNNTTSSTPPDDNKKLKSNPSVDLLETDTDSAPEAGDDNEFERQETPPRLKKPSGTPQKSLPARKNEDGETQSEDEEATSPKNKFEKATKDMAEDYPAPAKRPKAPPTGRSKGLGTIGGKRQTKPKSLSPSPTPTPSSSSPSPPRHKHEPPESLTYEGTTDEDADVEPYHTPPKPNNTQKHTPKTALRPGLKRSRGLGVIGGKKKKQPTPESEPQTKTASDPEPEPEPEPSNKPSESYSRRPHPPPKKNKPLGKIGVIGGHKSKLKASQNSSSEAPKPSRTESVSPPAKTNEEKIDTEDEAKKKERALFKASPLLKAKTVKRGSPAEPEREETEEEKADRKREELKKQLEAKSKVPARKKRRF
ncbi:XRCC4-like factor-domain-containing protein [Aspergillus recurvatus]